MFFLKSDYKSAIAIIIGLLMLSGCAASRDRRISIVYPQNNESGGWPDKKLEKRFQEYWSSLFAGRVEEAYQIETPLFREMVPLGKYNNYVKHTRTNKLMNVEIRKIAKETDFQISVAGIFRTQVDDDKPVNTPIIDRWVFVDKNWYHVIKDPLLLSF